MASQLEQLKQMTTVVADTGDFESMQRFKPQDATTNPSLIYKAAGLPQYQGLIKEAQKRARSSADLVDQLLVIFGREILKIVPGRVSTEVDAQLSYDSASSIEKAKKLIALYEQEGIGKERILIKLAATWEGIEAAKVLQKEGIACNMTLIFCLEQAALCAQAQATLISPFVGRIADWYKNRPSQSKDQGKDSKEDPGVASVKAIYHYYKSQGFKTEIMGASFRNKEQILGLAGCDLLTISPQLLEELEQSQEPIEKQLDKAEPCEPLVLSEGEFRFALGQNAMAYEKLGEGIRLFAQDGEKLQGLLSASH